MANKEKNKVNPFVRHLHEGEEILWESQQAESSVWKPVKQFLLACASLLAIPVVKIILDAIGLRLIDGIYLVIAFTFILCFVLILWTSIEESRAERSYAVTNQRLWHCNRQGITTLLLEEMQSVEVIKEESVRESLSFGPLFPIWSNVEDALRVKHLIDAAQKKHMQKMA